MEINSATLQGLQNTFSASFQSGFDRYAIRWQNIATRRELENSPEFVFGVLDRIPGFNKWLAERVYQNLVTRTITITPDDYEDTVAVDRNAILDDKIGIYTPALQMLGLNAAKLPDTLLAATMAAGASTTTYDGQFFFDTDHPINPDAPTEFGTQSNFFASKPLTWTNYQYVRAKMRSFRGANGIPMGVNPTTIVVPPSLEVQANTILHAQNIGVPVVGSGGAGDPGGAAGQSNVLANSQVKVVVFEELEAIDPTGWYLLDNSLPASAFVFVDRQAPKMVLRVDPADPVVFDQKKFVYGVDARLAVGYGLYFMAAYAQAGA